MKKKVIVISLGDPAGIGPEILIRSFQAIMDIGEAIPVVSGDMDVLSYAASITGLKIPLNRISDLNGMDAGKMNIFDNDIIKGTNFPKGVDSPVNGEASFAYVRTAANLYKKNVIDAVVTLPISKKSWHMAGRYYSGHTELFAEIFEKSAPAMMMIAGEIKTLLVTTHIPLSRVSTELTRELISFRVDAGLEFLKNQGLSNPLLFFSGLNPHAGEAGLIGREEEDVIRPAIRDIEKKGCRCMGPLPPDSVYSSGLRGGADLIVLMYHDQAMIPLKTFYREKLVNLTAGLPFIRTSPGHGTAFDIAYKGKADPSSFIESYRAAVEFRGSRC